MAPRMGCIVLVVVMAILVAGATAQMDCNMAIASMQPCLSYVTGPDPVPSPVCCDGIKNVNGIDKTCLCRIVAEMDVIPSVNATRVDSLPRTCAGVEVDKSLCPVVSPMPSPPGVSGPGGAPGPGGVPGPESASNGAASLSTTTAFVAAVAGAVAALAMYGGF